MTTRYFAGNSLAAFFRNSTSVVEVTTAGRFDSTYVASAINIPSGGTEYAQSATFSATGTVWFRFDFYGSHNAASNSSTGPSVYNGSTGIFRLASAATSNTLTPQYWNGSAWTNTGSSFTYAASTNITFVIKIILNTSFEVYINGSLVSSGSGWSGGGTTATAFRAYGINASSVCFVSQVMVADYDIRDSHFKADALSGNSATNTGGTGAYTTINETVLDESTAVSVAASGNKQGQTHTGITVPVGSVIGAMVINARVRATGSITDAKLGVRSGGTNYSSSGLGANGGYEPRSYIVTDDPATATRFTQSGYNAAEIYEEAA